MIQCFYYWTNIYNLSHSILSHVLPWLTISFMMFVFITKRTVFFPTTIASCLLAWRNYLFHRPEGRHLHISVTSYHQALLFPVHLAQAFIQSSTACLSCVRVPVQWCDGHIQRSYAIRRRGRKFRPRSKLALLGLLCLSSIDTTYAIPSSGYGLVKEKTSDKRLQVRQIEKVINKLTLISKQRPTEQQSCASPRSPQEHKKKDPNYFTNRPRVFIADTDSTEHILDTGTNGFIATNQGMLKNYEPCRGNIKGVNGEPTVYSGTGILPLTFVFDCGMEISVEVKAVHVPKCPYNLIPPQLLVGEFKKLGMFAECRYDDESHTIELTDPQDGVKRTLTSFSKPNKLFSVRTNIGYRSFFCHVVNTEPDWCSFAGALHVIPHDDEPDTDGTEELDKTREPVLDSESVLGMGKTREPVFDSPNLVEDDSKSTESERNLKPHSIDFLPQDARLGAEDPATIVRQRKQSRLITIHEKLGHFSFPKLRLLA